MGLISGKIRENKHDLALYKHAPVFAPAGQSTQMIVGATPDSDLQILRLTEGLYKKYRLKRVFYSAYVPVSDSALLPPVGTKPPLLREHRLYQADWLLRFYGFSASEILDENTPSFDPLMDPKCCWALRHMEQFPIDVNRAEYAMLLRVPGIGIKSAKRIVTARREGSLTFEGLRRLGVVLKRAQYFVTCSGKMMPGLRVTQEGVFRALTEPSPRRQLEGAEQLSFFDTPSSRLSWGDSPTSPLLTETIPKGEISA